MQQSLSRKAKIPELVKKFPTFMEPKNSLPCSQESYPELYESSPYSRILFL